ncbi:hypothetical protein [Pedobacter sp. ASV28]|uniref:hypothetical protein n=1 Tax=Pedobacter sp. ASV28 TaxID=2795123 RepID=UPI0018EAA7D2|nr:hypothetical protein [Pedobacter sp. ASV28]
MKKFIFFLIALSIFFQSWGQKLIDYDYPVKPGSKEWKMFKSTQERVDACQIPENILKEIDTRSLLQVCLKYPLLSSYTASNSPYEGIKNIIGIFNGLTEFIKRPDGQDILFEYYKNKDINTIINVPDKGSYTFDICALELLLSQKQLIERFDKQKRFEVLKTIMKKYEDKAKYADYFGFYGKMTTSFVGNKYKESLEDARIENDAKKKLFVEKMLIADFDLIDKIIGELQNYMTIKK